MNIIIASGPVIIEDDKVLLNQHGEDDFWKFPGGKVEEFDFADPLNALEEACKREVKQENGIGIRIIRPLKPMLVRKNDDTWVVLIHYLAERIGEIKLGADIRKSERFPVRNLPEKCAPNIRPVIDEYLASLK